MDFIEELTWRGMIHTVMPGTEEQLKKEMTTAYLGIDPTADSLHIGHLVGVMMLKHFQRAGHKPIALVGGATGMIGDPSMKSQERKLLDEETLRHNQEAIKKQLAKFLDFDSDAPNAAELVNNYDWMKNFSFLDFIRDVGKHITVNYMMAKDSVKKRLSGESQQGMSFTEFSYQLVQGYDFLTLYKDKNCRLQLGGSDQWGNITTGTELIRRTVGGEAYALTCPLITKADGGKFGKTESGNVWLDPRYTSPYKFYQFWLNVSDADAEKYIKIFTELSREEIQSLVEEQEKDPGLRPLQKRLAKEITTMVHSAEEYDAAVEAFQKNIKKKRNLDEAYRGLGIAYFELEDYEAAVEAFELALEHETKETAVFCSFLGASYLETGDYDKALDVYERGLACKDLTEELEQEIQLNLIVVYERMGNWDAAKKQMDKYVEKYPDDNRVDKEAEFLETR